MKILLVNQAYYPDQVASAQYLTDYAEFLVSQGHDVSVLASRFAYDDHKTIFHMNESHNGVKIHRAGSLLLLRGTRFARVINALLMNLAFAWHLARFARFDHIIALTSPPLVGFVALIFGRLRGSKFTYWIMDINPDQAILAGWIKKGSLRASLLKLVLKFILKQSDSINVLDNYMKKRIEEKGIDPNKVHVHSLWIREGQLTISPDQNNLKRNVELEGKFVVLYAGNHSICHPLDTLLQAACDCREDLSIAFIFVGKGDRVRDVLDFKSKNELKNIHYFEYQKSWQETLYMADLHVIVMGNEYVGVVHPCKIYNILSTYKPFVYIGKEASHIGKLIQSERVGFRIDMGDSRGLVHLIYEIKGLKLHDEGEYITNSNKTSKLYIGQPIMNAMMKELNR